MKQEDLFFVEVHEPDEVQRNLLESLKDVVSNLHRFEKFKDTRKEKLILVARLRKILKETNTLMAKLKTALPESKLRDSIPQPAPKKTKKHKKNKTKKATHVAKPQSEMDHLQSELTAIEDKLRTLQ